MSLHQIEDIMFIKIAFFLIYMHKRRNLSYFYSLMFPPDFGGNLNEGAAWKASSSLATVPKKAAVCARSGWTSWVPDIEGTRHSGGIWAEFAAVRTTPDSAKKQACHPWFSDGMPVHSYSFFARGRASSSRTRRSICFSMAVRRSSGRLMDGCRVKRKPIKRRSWLRCFVPMTSRQIAS